jgi:small-conductance mechanosensitive channel
VNLAIFERFAEEGIQFAFPTQTLFIKTDVSAEPTPSTAQLHGLGNVVREPDSSRALSRR